MPPVTIATRTLYVTTQSAHLSAFVKKALQGMEQLAPVTITKYWMQPVVQVFSRAFCVQEFTCFT